MRRFLFGILLGLLLAAPPLWALRIARPPEFSTWNSNRFTQLNDTLLQFWNITNGRITLDVVTVDPDGTRTCSVGEQVLFDTGTDQLCICVNASTKQWNCANLT